MSNSESQKCPRVTRFLKIHLHPQVTSEQTAKDEKNPSARLKWPHTGIVDMGEHRGKLTRQAAWDKPECSALTVHRCAKITWARKLPTVSGKVRCALGMTRVTAINSSAKSCDDSTGIPTGGLDLLEFWY